MEIEKNNVVIIPDGGRDGRDNAHAADAAIATRRKPRGS